jgi:2-methylcitrate dehydratase PrpD
VRALLDEMWERFGRLTVDDLPDDARTVASQCILDWFACALAGASDPLVRILHDEFADYEGPCTVVGCARRMPAMQAALVNGAAGHALDFDDAHLKMGGHPTAPLLPAAWALAEEIDASGAQLISAFVTGFEVESRLGLAIGREHYAKGWHQTSTIGVFGAAAAAARLLGLDAGCFAHAIGIAASQSSGLKANFGTMTKPFHAGHAAERGLLAARLAARGFTANPDALSANQGLAQAAGGGRLRVDRVRRHHDDWLVHETLFKYHASCYLTHAAIDGVARLVTAASSPAGHIRAIRLEVNPPILDVCGIEHPATGLECKFSLRATAALAALGRDTADPSTFADATAADPEVCALIDVVQVDTDPALTNTQIRVTVTTVDDESSTFADSGVPLTDLALQTRLLHRKFAALATPALGPEGAQRTLEQITGLADTASVRTLLA